MKTIITILLLAGLTNCGLSQKGKNVEGGPCSYAIEKFPATIILTGPSDETGNWYEIFFAISPYGETDTITYSGKFSHYLSAEEFKKNDYHVGQQMTYEHKTITSGSCSPDYYVLKMEEYKK